MEKQIATFKDYAIFMADKTSLMEIAQFVVRENYSWKSHTNLTHPGKYFRPSKVKIMRPTSPK